MSSELIFVKPQSADQPDKSWPRCAMLGNFGNAVIQNENVSTKTSITISDPYYMSPEDVKVYRGEDYLAVRPGKKSDIFALGVLMLEMCNLERKGEN